MAVMLYVRYPLSLRNVEDLLSESLIRKLSGKISALEIAWFSVRYEKCMTAIQDQGPNGTDAALPPM